VPVLKFQDQLKRVIQQNVDLLVFPSEISRDVLSSRISHRRSIVLPNYVADIGVESTTDTDGVSPYFLVLGRLTPEKGVDQLLNHWPPSTPLVIAGDGPQRGELEKLASGKNVDFVGFVGPEIRDPLLRGAAGLVLPSITLEADPLVVAQALSAGTACVAREGTSSAQLSLLSPSVLTYSSADSLAQVLDQLLGNRRREEARTLYESRWSDRVWLKSYKSNVVEALCAP
jgi:glycosyltransferase involved in cell wall biosynthesis